MLRPLTGPRGCYCAASPDWSPGVVIVLRPLTGPRGTLVYMIRTRMYIVAGSRSRVTWMNEIDDPCCQGDPCCQDDVVLLYS